MPAEETRVQLGPSSKQMQSCNPPPYQKTFVFGVEKSPGRDWDWWLPGQRWPMVIFMACGLTATPVSSQLYL